MDRDFNDQELIRRKKLKKLQLDGHDPFLIQKFTRNYTSASFKTAFKDATKESLHDDKTPIIVSGRVMAIRQSFVVIKDFYGTVQLYVGKDGIDEQTRNTFNDLDIGDIIGVHGTPMKTNTNEATVRVKQITLLSKALKPLPEKFHGLVDEEERARRRYVDLIVNEQSFKTFVTRSKIISIIRKFMEKQDFIEVETPVLQAIHGGAAARPFITKHNTLNRNFYLRVATELHLKRLIVGGMEKVFEIGRVFRNEGMDTTHNPEFTSMEAY
jgi:lysyl-tRNA synthetase class 2